MKPGREGIALGRELLSELPPGSPGTDELVGEVATAINDLRQAMEDLAEAWRMARPLGGSPAERLRAELDEVMAAAEGAYPQVVANVRWPSRYRDHRT